MLPVKIDIAGRQCLSGHRQEETDAQIMAADGENIRALARIAEAQQRRLDKIDGGQTE